jgi:hypothetical protein
VALGTRGSVYSHLVITLIWLRVEDINTGETLVYVIALNGAREASRVMRSYEWLSRIIHMLRANIYDG